MGVNSFISNIRKVSIVRFLCGGILFLLLLLMADFMIGKLLESCYVSSRYGIFARQNYCLSESKEDIIILGSSTAAHHYIPSILSDSLKMSCFNAGSDGMCIYYHYAILSSYIKNRKPKLVLYDVGATDVLPSNSATFSLDAALDRLAPHYGQYATIDSMFSLKGWQEKIKMNSLMYRYNSKLVQLIKCHFIPSHEDAGYEAVYGQLPDSMSIPVIDNMDTDYELYKETYLYKLIQMTKRENIGLIFVYSPRYQKGYSAAINRIKQIAEMNTIPFIDMVNAPSLMNPKYFRDESHLNDEGAKMFSKCLVEHIENAFEF